MEEASDRDLVLRTRSGELEAFGEVVRRYQTSVFNVCYRLMGERHEAEDMAQESFLRAYDRLASYDVDRPFGPWVRRLAANLCLNVLAKRQVAQVELQDEVDLPGAAPPTPEAIVEQAERHARLRAAIRALPPRYRAVIELRHFQELSYEEIADALRIPLSDVRSHLFRARRALARRLTTNG
jgi:RNA polymerase sigma-70 factor (ECF subfamily)